MKKILFIVILTSLRLTLHSQNACLNWYFGGNCGITFTTNPPTALPGCTMNPTEGCSSISDSAGNLLFFSDGVTVWNSTLDTMSYGTGLYGSYSATQSCLILPDPGDNSKYYIFTAPELGSTNPLSFSGVDMNLNNGLGGVTFKNLPLLYNSTEKLTAVRHSNGIDIWVLGHSYATSNFYAYLITSSGVNPIPVISSIGMAHGPPLDECTGYMKFSPCGDKLAVAVSYGGFLEIYDFDNSTGHVSNNLLLGDYTGLNPSVYGVEFSPDGSRLYVSFTNASFIGQYDLTAGSPASIIASLDTIYWEYPNFYPEGMQLGPDGQLYIIIYGYSELSCIKKPNLLGAACDFQYNYVWSGPLVNGQSGLGLPNYLTSNFCNLNVGENETEILKDEISFFPNPNTGTFIITNNNSFYDNTMLEIFDLYGKLLWESFIPNGENSFRVNLKSAFADGIYYCRVKYSGNSIVKKWFLMINAWEIGKMRNLTKQQLFVESMR